jgi:hypothetical protein
MKVIIKEYIVFLAIKEYIDGSGFYHICGNNEKSILAGNTSFRLDGNRGDC